MKRKSESKEKEQLLDKIKLLSEKQEKDAKHLDQCLQIYHEKIALEERKLLQLLIERSKNYFLLYKSFYRSLSAEERAKLEGFLVKEIQGFLPIPELPVELKAFYEQMTRPKKTPGNRITDYIDKPQEERPKVNPPQSEELDFKTHRRRQQEEGSKEKQKAKKKNLTRLYKRLVKALHPDLELESELKVFKEEIMKRVIHAYEKRDLYELMEIEKEQIDLLPEEEEAVEEIDYCAVLEGKIEDLEQQLEHLFSNPKYSFLHRFGEQQSIDKTLLFREHEKLKEMIEAIRNLIERLKGPDAEAILLQLLLEL